MPTSTIDRAPHIELEPVLLPPDVLARVGYDVPPGRRQRKPAERLPRELRETRRQMTYHWF